jgi:hypothetical protein
MHEPLTDLFVKASRHHQRETIWRCLGGPTKLPGDPASRLRRHRELGCNQHIDSLGRGGLDRRPQLRGAVLPVTDCDCTLARPLDRGIVIEARRREADLGAGERLLESDRYGLET